MKNQNFTFSFSILTENALYLILKSGITPEYSVFNFNRQEIDSPGFDFVLGERLLVNTVKRKKEYQGLLSTNSNLTLLFSNTNFT